MLSRKGASSLHLLLGSLQSVDAIFVAVLFFNLRFFPLSFSQWVPSLPCLPHLSKWVPTLHLPFVGLHSASISQKGALIHVLCPGFTSVFPSAWWLNWERILLQCGRPGFDPWVGKIPWRRERLPTPVFWPGESHGLYSLPGHKESDTTERPSLSLYLCHQGLPLHNLALLASETHNRRRIFVCFFKFFGNFNLLRLL